MEMQERADIEFANIDIDCEIRNVIDQREEKLVLDVYEWTTIEYYASLDSTVTDVMGYGINHEMTFDVVDGEYILVDDSFDERHITGVCSDDKLLAEEDDTEFVEEVEISVSENTTRVAYNVQAAINYANTYCGVGILMQDYTSDNGVNLEGNHKNFYNQDYEVHEGRDCANFVSQCIYAGGLPTDSVWYPESWYWTNAKRLSLYLQSKEYQAPMVYDAESRSVNYNVVYPGNPVYWLYPEGSSASGHQMICTGYNSVGIPVVNGHNPDMFRVPLSWYTVTNPSSNDIYTIQIVTADLHTHVSDGEWYSNASSHFYKCKHCRENFYYQAHNIVTLGSRQYCSVCSYSGPFAARYSLSVCGELGTDTSPRD